MNPAHNGGARTGAFTLIELLAVLAVVLLLASLLLPLAGQAYQRAHLVRCASNLRQLYALCVGFAEANDKYLPQGLSENPRQLSARAGYTNFRQVDAYMREFGYPPWLWYCPAFSRYSRFGGDETAWGDPAYYGSGNPGATGTPGEFPIGYCYVGNLTPANIHKFVDPPPRTLDDLVRTNAPFAWDYCLAPRPSPYEAANVPQWDIFPHFGPGNPAVCQYLMANGSVRKKFLPELVLRYHYIYPGEIYW